MCENSSTKIKNIATQYKKAITNCMKMDEYDKSELMMFDNIAEIQEKYSAIGNSEIAKDKKFILRVNFVLASMEKKYAMLLWKEFFFHVNDFWWMAEYTRSSFYRNRAKALKEFLCLF